MDYGLIKKHHFEMPAYFGQDEDEVLLKILPDVENKLIALSTQQ